jgi:hypothetical protein
VHPVEIPLRAPAYGRKTARFELLTTALAGLLSLAVGCKHRNPSRIYLNRQTCFDCGCQRQYSYEGDGVYIGPWRTPIPPASTARPRAERNGRAAILNPGADNPLFQPRPRLATNAPSSYTQLIDTSNSIMDRWMSSAVVD